MRKKIVRITGIIMILLGAAVLALFAYKKISRELYLRKLLDENIVFEIPRLNIRVPVLEGTDSKALQVSAGHFPGTGALGEGITVLYMRRYSTISIKSRSAMKCI